MQQRLEARDCHGVCDPSRDVSSFINGMPHRFHISHEIGKEGTTYWEHDSMMI